MKTVTTLGIQDDCMALDVPEIPFVAFWRERAPATVPAPAVF